MFHITDGSGEFLDSWLMLVEKMVNVKNVLESTHTLPTKPASSGLILFDPLKYLISTHKVSGYIIKKKNILLFISQL